MSELPEDLVFARHPRRRGEVLIVGVGAVGSLTAQQLVRMGISPLWLLDKDILKVHNIVRHVLGEPDLGKNKAEALADRIHREFSQCEAHGIPRDFLAMSWEDQLRRVAGVDLVVAATDELDCQRRINRACLLAETPAVYPAVWVDDRVRPAEVGEVLWVLPGRHTPCYECAVTFRQGSLDAQAARGAMLDIQQLALATAHVVGALLDPADENSAILDPRRTLIYLHGFTPTSPRIRASFPVDGLFSRNIEVPFPQELCPACGGQAGNPRPRHLPGAPLPMTPWTQPRQPRGFWS